jgi:outer membrane receptor for ferrienterochelin and colicin
MKSRIGGVTFNGAVFYTDIKNLQTTLDAGSCSSRVVFNVPKAHTMGVEGELSARLAPGFDLSVSGSLLEAEFDSTVKDGTGAVIGGIRDGNRLPSVPKFQISINATYTRTLTDTMDGYVTASFQHVGNRYTQASDQEDNPRSFVSGLPFGGATGNDATVLDLQLPSYEIINLSAGLQMDNGLDLIAYVNNAWRRERAAVVRPRARRPGAAGLLDRPAAHGRHDDPQVVLVAASILGGGRETGRPFSMGRAAWPRPGDRRGGGSSSRLRPRGGRSR